MQDQELTSGLRDFFAEDDKDGKGAKVIGSIGMWLLHLVVFTFAIYSAYHGISATARYHADNGLGMAAGIVGIVGIEIVFIGLYSAFFARRITGTSQQFAAGATALLGFTLSCLGILGDSQLQAGLEMSGWLNAYLTWGLPIAPAFMVLGAAVVMALEPKHLRLMAKTVKEEEFEDKRHTALMKKRDAELSFAKDLANFQLNSLTDAARFMYEARRSPEVQAAIQRSALVSAPEVLRAIGIDLPYGTVIEGQVVQSPAAPPATDVAPAPSLSEAQAARIMAAMNQDEAHEQQSLIDRLLRRRPAPAPVDPELVAALVAALSKNDAVSNTTHSGLTDEERRQLVEMYEQARRNGGDSTLGQGHTRDDNGVPRSPLGASGPNGDFRP